MPKKRYSQIIIFSTKSRKKYENHIDYWVSQKDRGIFDAFNKGLRLSSGDYICILNSGDYFTENSINFIVKKILEKKDLDILFGTVLKKKKFSGFYPDKIFFNLNIIPSLMSTFVKLSIYKEIGLFDTNLVHYSDYDFFYKCIKKKDIKWYATKKNKPNATINCITTAFSEFKSTGSEPLLPPELDNGLLSQTFG